MKFVYFVPKKISIGPNFSRASSFQLLLLALLTNDFSLAELFGDPKRDPKSIFEIEISSGL
jgi:hypothetical protein